VPCFKVLSGNMPEISEKAMEIVKKSRPMIPETCTSDIQVKKFTPTLRYSTDVTLEMAKL
jgi:ribosome-binding factor A